MASLGLWDTLQEHSLSSQEVHTLISAWGRAARAGDAEEFERLRASFAHSHHCCVPNVIDASQSVATSEAEWSAWSPSEPVGEGWDPAIETADPYPSTQAGRPAGWLERDQALASGAS